MKSNKQSKLSVINLISWIKSSNPTIDDMRQLESKIKSKKIDRKGISDDEFTSVKEIVSISIDNLESDCPTLANLEHYDISENTSKIEMETITEAEIDTSPLVEDVQPNEIIKLAPREKKALFDLLKSQITNNKNAISA